MAGLMVGVYSFLLHLFFWKFRPDLRPTFENPFVVQSLSVLISFSVCFRTNIAWSRFWEACDQVKLMYSKWCDAYTQIQAFINSAAKRTAKTDTEKNCQLAHLKKEMTHYFTLLSCVAVERLMRGDIRRMQLRRKHGVSWSKQVVFRKDLRINDLTGAGELCTMRPLSFKSFLHEPARQSIKLNSLRGDGETKPTPASADDFDSKARRRQSMSWIAEEGEVKLKDDWQTPMLVIDNPSRDELRMLEQSDDRISLVIFWINQLITDNLDLMGTPPPIMSRVYQEISNGALGYNQAEKLTDIPFPFIFAQLLAIAIIFVAIVGPISFTLITGHSWLGPMVSTLVIMTFWALNEMAKELENPFGPEANNVDIVDDHERFICCLGEIYGGQLPEDRAYQSPHARLMSRRLSGDITAMDGEEHQEGEQTPVGSFNDPEVSAVTPSNPDDQVSSEPEAVRKAGNAPKQRGRLISFQLEDNFNPVTVQPAELD